MESARKAPKAAATPPQPAVTRRPPPSAVSRANALQGQIGASGVTALLTTQTQAPLAFRGPQIASAGPSQMAAPALGPKGLVHSASRSARGTAAHPGGGEAAASHDKDAHEGAHRDKKGAAKAHAAAPGEEADKKAPGPAGEALDAAAGGKEGGGAVVKLHMPEPPTAPSKATQHRIAGVRRRAGGRAKAQGSLPAGAKQVGDARKAVTPPDAERIAAARAQLIASVNAAPSPEIVKLAADIRRAIRERRPPDEDALAQAEPAKEASEAGNQLNASVQGESKKVQDNYGSLNTPPQPTPTQPGALLPPQPAAAPTPAVNASAAVPDAVPAHNVALDKDADATRKQAADAGMNKPAAAEVKSGPIAEAREAQGELDQVAKEDPAKVLAKQKEALTKADADMGALQMQALEALTSARASTVTGNAARQHGMVGTEEQMRAQAGAEAKAAFDQAQSEVQALLKPLASTAMDKWEAAKTTLTTQFKDDLRIVKDRVDERHSGVGGWFVGVWDSVTGLPGWATDAYDAAENNFAEGVIAKLTEISTEVNSVIKVCETIIENARNKIHGIFEALPESSRKWAEQEQGKFDTQLDKLGQEVVAARDGFNKDISKRAAEAVDEVRAEIAELRKKAGGLVGRIVDAVKRFVDDPVKFIIEGLLDILGISPPAFWAVVAKIKKVVKDIVDDPIGFANNLMKGIGQGFSQFFDNFAEHMIRGFLSWLLGDLKDVQIPKEISVKSIITFFLQLMGITWPNIRKILAKKIGEKNVALIEKVYSLISMLVDQGPQGIYEMIKEKLDPQSIVDQVVQMAVDYMVTAIAKQVAVRVALLFNPAGAIIQAIEAIYRVLKWVFQNAAKIFTLIETIVNGLADIISGNIGGFAKAVERGLEMLIAPVLGFIADYFSLGDLPQMVAKQIKSFREWILGKIEAGFDWLIAKGKALLAALGIGGKEKDNEKGAYDGHIGEVVHWTADDERHELWIGESGAAVDVMMASAEEGPVRAKLTKYEGQVAQIKGRDAKERKKRAITAIAEARKLLTLTLEAAKATKAALANPDPQPAVTKAKDEETESWEELLWPHLQTIQIALHLIDIPKTVITPGGAKASTVTAEPLSSLGAGGSRPRGNLRGWDHVLVIDHEKLNPARGQWGPAYWVAAHLVSEKLHGPGDPWNTTPMRKVDNKAMETEIENEAKSKIAEDEVLFYVASVEYHSGLILEDFPSSISIEWGTLRYKNKQWERGDALKPFAWPLAPPPLDPNYIPDINDIRREGLMKRGVPVRFAMAMDDERRASGPFTAGTFATRMANLYGTKARGSNDKLQEGIDAVMSLVNANKIQFGK